MSNEPRMMLSDTAARLSKKAALAAKIEEFYNQEHDAKGRFTGPGGGSDHGVSGKLVAPHKVKGGTFSSVVKTKGEISPGLKQSLGHAGAAIDSVHGSPSPVSISETPRVFGRGTHGLYWPGKRHIEITKALGPHSKIDRFRSSVIIHEYGHHIDHMIGDPSVNDEKLLHALKHSNSYKRLLARQAVKVAITPVLPLSAPARIASIPYALNKRELFARAYNQWIVSKSTDPVVKKQFKQGPRAWRWSARDFKPIGKEFDRIFADQGLLK